MPIDPQILDLRGVVVNLKMTRGKDALLYAEPLEPDGSATPLAGQDFVLKVYDANGTLKHTWTNGAPASSPFALSIPASVTSSLMGRRSHTWKYEITRRDQTTNFTAPYFRGDLQIDPDLGATW